MLTQTWLKCNDATSLTEASPPNYSHLSKRRPSGQGGGVAAIYGIKFKCTPISFGEFT